MTRLRTLLLIVAGLALQACSTNLPAVDGSHPASPQAQEAPTRTAQHALVQDEATRRTHELIAKRQADARAAENAPPTDETNIAKPANPTTPHEHQP